MTLLFLSAVLLFATLLVARTRLVEGGSLSFSGFNGIGVLAGFLFFVFIATTLGRPFGLPLIAALLVHEFGRAMGYRMLGHANSRVRLLPFLSCQRSSDRPLKTDGELFLASIMGPAFSLGPLTFAMALSMLLRAQAPELSETLWVFAITCGTVNFVALLPFAPFDGEKCARAATVSFWPALAPAMAVFMSTAMVTAAFRTGSLVLFGAAMIGAITVLRRPRAGRPPLFPDDGLLALSAYVFTMAAHFSAAWPLLSAYFT